MRVVVADDEMPVRSGLTQMLTNAGVTVVGDAADADDLLRVVALEEPDVAIVDIRLSPKPRGEGHSTVSLIRERHPATAIVLLSQVLEVPCAEHMLAHQPAGLGYLLKERAADVSVLVDVLHRVAKGEFVLGPTIVAQLIRRRKPDPPLNRLTVRETETLASMAGGLSNAGIARELGISERSVEAMCAHVFQKLDLCGGPRPAWRFLAVWLRIIRDLEGSRGDYHRAGSARGLGQV